MSSSRKTFKANGKSKNSRLNNAGNSCGKDDRHNAKLMQQKSKFDKLSFEEKSKINRLLSDPFAVNISASSSLALSPHPVWPDLPQTQSELFFECTLFLYSVLALFLQYLSLYKTLWWLPKSHWHSSMKFYLINPYVLSCIGLLLGIRVTKCFWCTISDKSTFFLKNYKGWKLAAFRVIEISIRLFLLSAVTSSFFFSFSRIYAEFGSKALFWFSYPFVGYFLLIHGNLMHYLLVESTRFPGSYYYFTLSCWFSIFLGIPKIMARNTQLIDLDSVVHRCIDCAARIREEARILLADFDIRIRYCIYAGLFTAYFSILMPRLFIPNKTAGGEPMVMLVDDVYVFQLFVIVAFTAFLLYATYLLPIQYLDLMHRCAVHLGCWQRIQPNRFNAAQLEESHVYDHQYRRYTSTYNGVIMSYKNEFYESKSHPGLKWVAAHPGNGDHLRLYKTAHDPVLLVSYMCVFQLLLVGAQFWALILSTDWQKIVTFVLLMFANYLLLAKIFKDRVVIGRIFKPSAEDQHLIAQLQKEFHQRQQQQQQRQMISNASKQHLKIA